MKTLRNTSFITLAIVALALLVSAPAALATTLGPYTATVNNQLTDLSNVAPESGVLPEFNPALYPGSTLNSVTISVQGTGTTVFNSIYNFGVSSTEFLGTQNTALGISDPTNSGINTLLGSLIAHISGSSPGSINGLNQVSGGLTVGAGNTIGPEGPYMMGGLLASETITDPASLVLFEGSGDLDFLMSTGSNFQLTTNGADDLIATVTTDAGGTISVTYDYSGGPPVVPEPGTLSLFGTGLLGLAGMLRARFRKSS
jgi:hypothetical protein